MASSRALTSFGQTIIPYVPIRSPRLARLIYDMIMAHFLTHDKEASLSTDRRSSLQWLI